MPLADDGEGYTQLRDPISLPAAGSLIACSVALCLYDLEQPLNLSESQSSLIVGSQFPSSEARVRTHGAQGGHRVGKRQV